MRHSSNGDEPHRPVEEAIPTWRYTAEERSVPARKHRTVEGAMPTGRRMLRHAADERSIPARNGKGKAVAGTMAEQRRMHARSDSDEATAGKAH